MPIGYIVRYQRVKKYIDLFHVFAMSEEVKKAQAAQGSSDTIFGKILRKEIPCTFIHEDEQLDCIFIPMEQQSKTLAESYQTQFNPKSYLNKYYTDVEESPLYFLPQRPIYDFYKSYSATHPGGLKVLDIGCGPVIANVISAAQYASEIVLAEYTELNRKEVTKWLDKDSDAHDWTPFFKYVISEVEGRSSEDVATREEKVRSTIKAIVPCDLTKDPVMSLEYMQEYNVVQAFLCLEPASSNKEEYLSVVKRIWSLVKPGGVFIVYSVQRKELPGPGVFKFDGISFYDLRVSEEFVKSSLLSAGFDCIRALPLITLKDKADDHSTFTLFFCKKKT